MSPSEHMPPGGPSETDPNRSAAVDKIVEAVRQATAGLREAGTVAAGLGPADRESFLAAMKLLGVSDMVYSGNISDFWHGAVPDGGNLSPPPPPPIVPPGSSPQDYPGMEQRVTALEADMKEMKASVARVEGAVGRIEGALRNLPTQSQIAALPTRESARNTALAITGVVLAAMVGISGLLLAASGNQLSAFQAGLSSVEAIVASRQPLPPVLPAPTKP